MKKNKFPELGNIDNFALKGRNRKVSESESVRIGKRRSLKSSDLKIISVGNILNWKVICLEIKFTK